MGMESLSAIGGMRSHDARGAAQKGAARCGDGHMFAEDFAGRCLPFDTQAATHYAAIVAQRTRARRPITVEDAQIAAIALSHRLTLVTCNTRGFAGIEGLTLFHPWQSAA